MRAALWLAVLGLSTALQTTLPQVWGTWRFAPDLLLASVILAAVYDDGEEIWWFAPLLGYARDLYSGGVVGGSVLSFFLLAWFIRLEKRRLNFDSYLLVVMVTLATVFDGSVSVVLRHMAGGQGISWWPLSALVAARAIGNVLLVEALRLAWKGVLERLTLHRPARRRFREV